MSKDEKDQPRTGDGKTGGEKPHKDFCAQRLANGVRLIVQPSKGWGTGGINNK
jgi:hypothetical protein